MFKLGKNETWYFKLENCRYILRGYDCSVGWTIHNHILFWKNKQFKNFIENKFNTLWTNTTRVLTCFDSYVCVTNKNDKSHLLWHSAIIVKLCIVELFPQKNMGFILRIFNIFLWLSFSLDMVCKKYRCTGKSLLEALLFAEYGENISEWPKVCFSL